MREKLLTVTIKDCDVETYRGSGPGGQHRNKTDTAVRIRHRSSGAVGNCAENKSQLVNKRTAFRRMADSPTFRAWLQEQRRLSETKTESIERVVERMMLPEYLLVEVKNEAGEWVTA